MRRAIGRRGIESVPSPSCAPTTGSLTSPSPRKSPPFDPFRLHELELASEVRADEREHEPAIDAVVVEHALGKLGAIRGAAADHAVQPHHARHGSVARIGTTDVRARRRAVPDRVVTVVELVVAARIGAELGIVVQRTARQGGTAAPAAHHLRRDQLLVVTVARVVAQVAAKCGHTLMQLAERDIGAVAPQHLGLRQRRHPPVSSR